MQARVTSPGPGYSPRALLAWGDSLRALECVPRSGMAFRLKVKVSARLGWGRLTQTERRPMSEVHRAQGSRVWYFLEPRRGPEQGQPRVEPAWSLMAGERQDGSRGHLS